MQTTTTLTANEAAVAGGVLGGMFAFAMTIGLIYYILLVIAGWKMFEKAGEKGWKALIPIYNSYIYYKIVGMKNWFWATLIVAFVVSLATTLMGQGTQVQGMDLSTGTGIASFILTIALLVFTFIVSVMYAIRTSRAFGHGAWFAIGLFFLQGIFLLVLGFGKSKYDKKVVKAWEK